MSKVLDQMRARWGDCFEEIQYDPVGDWGYLKFYGEKADQSDENGAFALSLKCDLGGLDFSKLRLIFSWEEDELLGAFVHYDGFLSENSFLAILEFADELWDQAIKKKPSTMPDLPPEPVMPENMDGYALWKEWVEMTPEEFLDYWTEDTLAAHISLLRVSFPKERWFYWFTDRELAKILMETAVSLLDVC